MEIKTSTTTEANSFQFQLSCPKCGQVTITEMRLVTHGELSNMLGLLTGEDVNAYTFAGAFRCANCSKTVTATFVVATTELMVDTIS